MALKLILGNKNYSSWSMRPWLALKWGDIAFEEKLIALGGEGYGQSQIKAVYAITKAQGTNLGQLLRERFRVGKPDELSIREASQLIDELKNSAKEGG